MPIICSSSKNNEIETPLYIVLECLKIMEIIDEDIVLDCCSGNNMIWYNNINCKKKSWCEINKGIDFFDFNKQVDWIVGNLPFNKFKSFFKKILSLDVKKGFGIITLDHHITPNRIQTLYNKGFFLTKIRKLKIKEWKFGFNVSFFYFTKNKNNFVQILEC